MGINMLIDQFQNNLIEVVNSCQLPIGVSYFVAKDVFMQMELEYKKTLELEKKVVNESEEKKEEVE